MNVSANNKNSAKKIPPVFLMAGVLFLCLGAVLFGTLHFLESKTGQAFWLSPLNNSIPGRLGVDFLDIDLVSGTFEIDGLRLDSSEGRTLVSVQKISAKFSWLRLLRGQVYFSSIDIHGPRAELSIGRDGVLNLVAALMRPEASRSEETPWRPSFNLIVPSCRLTRGALVFLQPSNGVAIKISGLDIDLSQVDLVESQARLRLDADEFFLGPRKFKDVLIQCELDGQQIRFQRSGLSSDMGNLGLEGLLDLSPVYPDGFWADSVFPDRLGYAFTLFPENLDLKELPFLEDRLSGRVHGKINVRGQGADPDRLTADVTAQGRINDFWCQGMDRSSDAGFFATAQVSDSQVRLKPFNVVLPWMRLDGDGRLNYSSLDFSGDFSLGLDLADSPAGGIGVAGQVSSRVQVAGNLSRPEAKVFIQAHDLYLGKKRAGDAMAEVVLSQGLIDLVKIEMINGNSKLNGKGRVKILADDNSFIRDPLLSWSLIGEGISLDAFSPEIRGIIDFDATGSGTLFKPVADFMVSGQSLGMDGVEIGRVEIEAGWERGGLDVTRLELMNKGSFLGLEGHIQLLEPEGFSPLTEPIVQGTVTGGRILLEDFFSTASGAISPGGQVRGGLSRLEGQLHLKGSVLDLFGQAIESGSLDLGFGQGRVDIDASEIRLVPGAVVTTKGSLFLEDQTLDVRVETENFDLTGITRIRETPIDSGVASAVFRVQGPWKTPVAEGNLQIREWKLFGEPQPSLTMSLLLQHGEIEVKGEIGAGFEGRLDLESKGFSAALAMDELDLALFFRLAGLPEFSGRVSGGIQAKGVLGQWDRTQAKADLYKLSLFRKELPMIQAPRLKAAIENWQLSLPLTRVALAQAGYLNIQGQGDIRNSLDLTAQGEVPFDMIIPWLDPVTTAWGRVRISGGLTGSMTDPRLKAELLFNDLGLTLAGTDQRIQKLGGRIGFDGQTIEFKGVEGFLDEGRFNLDGRAIFEQGLPLNMDLRFKARQLALEIPDMMTLSMNSDLTLGGTQGHFNLQGEVVLLEGLYYRDVDLDLLAAATLQTRTVPLPEEKKVQGLLDAVDLDVNILRRQPLVVENNLADLEISPDLTLRGTAAVPVLSGRARVDSGTIRYQKVEFEVEKGVVDFINPYRISPEIDIEGQTEIRTWTIALKVSGTPEELKFAFTSNPPEQHADILSLIAFGKTTRELRASDGGGMLAPEQMFAALVADQLEKNVKDAAGLDYFEIKPQADADAPRVNVTVGADLSRQISVKYGVDIKGGETVQRVTTTYKLFENLLINGYQDTGGTFGGELKYRLEFR